MWTTVFITNSNKKAKSVEDMLIEEGFLVKVSTDTIDKRNIYEIMALDVEVDDVCEVLCELGIL